MIMDKKFIDNYDYKYVITSTSTDINIINVEVHRFSNKPLVFTIPSTNYDKLDEIIMEKMIMDFRKKKLKKLKSKWGV